MRAVIISCSAGRRTEACEWHIATSASASIFARYGSTGSIMLTFARLNASVRSSSAIHTSTRWQKWVSTVACTATSESGTRPSRASIARKRFTRSPAWWIMICCSAMAAALATRSSGWASALTKKHLRRSSTISLLGIDPGSKRGSTSIACTYNVSHSSLE